MDTLTIDTGHDDLAAQLGELETLSAIYDRDFLVDSLTAKTVCSITLRKSADQSPIVIEFRLTDDYPSTSSPLFELVSPGILLEERQSLEAILAQTVASRATGQPVLFDLIQNCQELLSKVGDSSAKPKALVKPSTAEMDVLTSDVITGKRVTDRKSRFQGHLARVYSKADVMTVLAKILSDTRVSKATRESAYSQKSIVLTPCLADNMWAYRLVTDDKKVIRDSDDDGEQQAGGRLAHLLEMVGAENVLVVVSRWLGGIQLGKSLNIDFLIT